MRLRHVVEFRHPSWYEAEPFGLLQRHRVSLCLHDTAGSDSTGPQVGPATDARFHGTSGHYQGEYDAAATRDAHIYAAPWTRGSTPPAVQVQRFLQGL